MIEILIDDQDRNLIEGKNIFLSSGYPSVSLGGRSPVRLHRLIMRPPKGYGVDHVNRNKLDVRRKNLRICRQAVNCLNVPPRKDCKSGVRGVWFDMARDQWAAQISKGRARESLGRFDSFDEAVAARKERELQLWGEYAPQ